MTMGRKPTDNEREYWIGVWNGLLARGRELHFRLKPEWQPIRRPEILGEDESYAWYRLIGGGAGENDRPKYGPFGQERSTFDPKMSYPREYLDDPEPEPEPSPVTPDYPKEFIESVIRIADGVEKIAAVYDKLAKRFL